jgi:hypothetical protein
MAKRSAWATQPKAEVRRLVREYSSSPLSEKAKEALKMREVGLEYIPDEQRRKLITANASFLTSDIGHMIEEFPEVAKDRTVPEKSAIKGLLRDMEKLKTLKTETQISFAKSALKHIFAQEAKELPERMRRRVRRYLKERGIPVEDGELIFIVNMHLAKTKPKEMVDQINITQIEHDYLYGAKVTRASRYDRAEQINKCLRDVCRGVYFTPQQKRTIKRWLYKQYPELVKSRIAAFKVYLDDPSKGLPNIAEIEKRFIEATRDDFSRQFATTQIITTVRRQATTTTTPTKLGNHKERIANYTPREKTPRERSDDLATLKKTAREMGKPFDTAEYCLSKIGAENAKAQEQLRTLLEKGQINKNALTSLFTSGSLTQKIFLLTANSPEFKNQFGEEKLNVLAKGLSYIGSQGKQIIRAKLTFQSTDLFRFLEIHKLIETNHGGGDVVYLARNGNGK